MKDWLATRADATRKSTTLPAQRTIGAQAAKPYGYQVQPPSTARKVIDALTGGASSLGERTAEQLHQGAYAGAAKTAALGAADVALSHPLAREFGGGMVKRVAGVLAPAEEAAPAARFSMADLPSERGPYDKNAALERIMQSGPIFDPAEAQAAQSKLPVGALADSAVSHAVASGDMLRNMQESGFAGGVPNTGVMLPTSGAGRAGTTTAAVASARQQMSPDQFRSLVNSEIARRGGASSPEVTMAATEQVARNLASRPF